MVSNQSKRSMDIRLQTDGGQSSESSMLFLPDKTAVVIGSIQGFSVFLGVVYDIPCHIRH